jgi:hypothetical protein
VIRSLDRKMPVGCRQCREILSIIATTRNIYCIYVFLISAHTKNLLVNQYLISKWKSPTPFYFFHLKGLRDFRFGQYSVADSNDIIVFEKLCMIY